MVVNCRLAIVLVLVVDMPDKPPPSLVMPKVNRSFDPESVLVAARTETLAASLDKNPPSVAVENAKILRSYNRSK